MPISYRRVLVGEFVHGPEKRISVHVPQYGNEIIPARQIRWLPAINELELPERVSEVIRRPNPFVSFDLNLYVEIFDRTFGAYVFKDGYAAKFRTSAERFTGDDNLDFIILAESIARMVQESETGSDISLYSNLLSLVMKDRNEKYSFDLSMNINSPGSILSKSMSVVPLVLACMLSLAQTCDAGDEKPNVKVINSSAPVESDVCTPPYRQVGPEPDRSYADWCLEGTMRTERPLAAETATARCRGNETRFATPAIGRYAIEAYYALF